MLHRLRRLCEVGLLTLTNYLNLLGSLEVNADVVAILHLENNVTGISVFGPRKECTFENLTGLRSDPDEASNPCACIFQSTKDFSMVSFQFRGGHLQRPGSTSAGIRLRIFPSSTV